MDNIACAVGFVLNGILGLAVFVLIVNAVISWLLAFGVLNMRNSFVYQAARFLDGFSGPILAPFRAIIPPLGGIDITPVIAILVIQAIQRYLLPWAVGSLAAALGGTGVCY